MLPEWSKCSPVFGTDFSPIRENTQTKKVPHLVLSSGATFQVSWTSPFWKAHQNQYRNKSDAALHTLTPSHTPNAMQKLQWKTLFHNKDYLNTHVAAHTVHVCSCCFVPDLDRPKMVYQNTQWPRPLILDHRNMKKIACECLRCMFACERGAERHEAQANIPLHMFMKSFLL